MKPTIALRIFLAMIFGVTFFGCTTPRHIIMVDKPIRNEIAPAAGLQITSFNVETTKKDIPAEKKLFMDEFADYLRYNRSIAEIEHHYPNLTADITIKPRKDIRRTWILDVAFFWPYLGAWPYTPWWGKTSVDIDLQLVVPGVDRSQFHFTKDLDFNVALYPYYRAGRLLTQNYRLLYADLFDEVGSYDFVRNWNGNNRALFGNPTVVPTMVNVSSAPHSDVDLNIPVTSEVNDKTFVLIIGNEQYANEIKVSYASNDASVFKEYAEKTLGIPAQNIHYLANGTYGQMLNEIDWITNVIKVFNGEAKVLVYYAGHGMPDVETRTALLLPVDGISTNPSTAVKLEYLYGKLSTYPAQSVTVFLDACFSGDSRNAPLFAGRGVRVRPRADAISGNLVVLTATSADETAFPLKDKEHGLFTYFLLKKLQETKGNADLKELSDYITQKVSQQSALVNSKSQTPQVLVGSDASATWQNWTLK
ncbi:MAG TPA: caspase family protein [Williamwhitmania sp.]|nr:caspase family protein [Williamwhitmania sp.]